MRDFAIGDIQGCYDALQRLLEKINFDDKNDRLWLVGDLVNRGTQSLAVLNFIRNLPLAPYITLGNHDLYLLSKIFNATERVYADDSLRSVLMSNEREEIGHWLRKQLILHYDKELNVVMAHAGIAPIWNLQEAIIYADELQHALRSNDFVYFLNNMYGNAPNCWSLTLTGYPRLRLIANYFTRMRYCDSNGCLLLQYKGRISTAPADHIPWFRFKKRISIPADIVFGHWSALEGQTNTDNLYALDTGCFWGGKLTALCLQDKQCLAVPGP